jgi:hypothetical protein
MFIRRALSRGEEKRTPSMKNGHKALDYGESELQRQAGKLPHMRLQEVPTWFPTR